MTERQHLDNYFKYLGAFSNVHFSPRILIYLLGPSGSLCSEMKAVTDDCIWACEHGEHWKERVAHRLEEPWFFSGP